MEPRKKMLVWRIGLQLIVAALMLGPGAASAQPAGCGQTLQSLVDAAPAGATIAVPPCIYRETVTIPKPLTLDGQGKAEIRGSDVWTNWTQAGNGWTSTQSVPDLGNEQKYLSDGRCGSTRNQPASCVYREQVFFDGTPLRIGDPGTTPVSGQFTLNSARQVQLADNPAGHQVEVTTRHAWITTGANDVTIRGFTMHDVAAPAQIGGLSSAGFDNWTAEGNMLSQSHGELISIVGGTGARVVGNDLGNAGEAAIGGLTTNALIQNNGIHDNGANFASGWGAAGVKLSGQSITLDGNAVSSNPVGLWADVGSTNWEVKNNKVHDNAMAGIQFEISTGASIHDNAVWNNGLGRPEWGYGAGILVQTSANAEVQRNTVAWNYAGISVIDLTRKDAPPSIAGNTVHDNVVVRQITNTDAFWANQLLFAADDTDGSRMALALPLFDGNQLWADQPEHYPPVRFTLRNTAWPDLQEYMSNTSDTTSRYLQTSEAFNALKAAGVPTGIIGSSN